MCLVDLNRSTLSCNHLWYHLIEGCSPSTTLDKCPGKTRVSGWVSALIRYWRSPNCIQEIKSDFCPFCAGWPISDAEFRLLGAAKQSGRHNSVSSSGSSNSDRSLWSLPQSSSVPTLVPSASESLPSSTAIGHKYRPSIISVSGARHLIRSGNLGGVAERLYDMTPVLAASEDNEHMNVLVDAYAGQPLDTTLDLAKTKREQPYQTMDTAENESAGGRKRSSRSFSDMFRR
jgi:hypothetical protein